MAEIQLHRWKKSNSPLPSGGPTNQCQLNEDKLNLRSQILKKFVDNKQRLELQVLLALQHLMHR